MKLVGISAKTTHIEKCRTGGVFFCVFQASEGKREASAKCETHSFVSDSLRTRTNFQLLCHAGVTQKLEIRLCSQANPRWESYMKMTGHGDRRTSSELKFVDWHHF